MNTLKELGDFVGIPQGSFEVARYSSSRVVGLKAVMALVFIGKQSGSMRGVIKALENLTPLTLETQIIGDRSGEEPFKLVLRLNPGGGITWHTDIEYRLVGIEKVFYVGTSEDSLYQYTTGGDISLQLGPGNYQFTVRRAGISTTGYVSLSKTFENTIRVTEKPKPSPPPPPPQPKPTITVQAIGDGSFKVSGTGFVPPNATVNILVGDGTLRNPLNFSVPASGGSFKDFPTGKICQRPGDLYFEASDGRIESGRQIFTDTIKISCPF